MLLGESDSEESGAIKTEPTEDQPLTATHGSLVKVGRGGDKIKMKGVSQDSRVLCPTSTHLSYLYATASATLAFKATEFYGSAGMTMVLLSCFSITLKYNITKFDVRRLIP